MKRDELFEKLFTKFCDCNDGFWSEMEIGGGYSLTIDYEPDDMDRMGLYVAVRDQYGDVERFCEYVDIDEEYDGVSEWADIYLVKENAECEMAVSRLADSIADYIGI